ncbi:hypothetical protein AALO_G00267050 [Alosa alosa]|uniref:Alpha-macroglobulin receptor-binding domain-containing protein n=1 Tax=Alosa alosa TaxID=278164 RepID=A0AAV6FL80_9TELE|nr:hypothetical protein AALO_G00267050 [Alosa alosa]
MHWSQSSSEIVNWLVKQQNPYGGFSSTQDTVVALQALALYATKVFSPHGFSTVTVQSAGGDKHQFDVNQHNTLLYQETALQDVPGKYSVEVTGSACASVGLQGSSILVDRVDKKDDHILVYLSQVPKDIHYQLSIRQDVLVNNLKPAVVKVYDYYQISDEAEAEYSSPCA